MEASDVQDGIVEDNIDLLGTADAMIWAEEFVKTCRKYEIDPVNGDDPEGFMVGWFANAMAAQENFDRRKSDTSLRDLVIGGSRAV